jgi:hypothetical protein
MPPSSWLRSIVKFYSQQSNTAVRTSNYIVHLSLEIFENIFIKFYVNTNVMTSGNTGYYNIKRLEITPSISE